MSVWVVIGTGYELSYDVFIFGVFDTEESANNRRYEVENTCEMVRVTKLTLNDSVVKDID